MSICACLPALRAQPQPPKSGVDLALAGRCAEAMPLLDAGMRDAGSALEVKRSIAFAA